MDWKTDWNERDNYARDGVSDWERLWSNYTALRNLLNSEYGFNITFQPPALVGYKTVPLDGMLNAVETALEALRVWPVPWTPDTTIWKAGGKAPDYKDINRWERNGKAVEVQAEKVRDAWYYSGEIFAGEI